VAIPNATYVARHPRCAIKAGRDWRAAYCAESYSRHCYSERGVAPAKEPSAHDRDHRHVSARDSNADAEPVCQVAEPQTIDHRRQRKTGAHRDRARRDDDSRAEAVGQMTRQRAKDAPREYRD